MRIEHMVVYGTDNHEDTGPSPRGVIALRYENGKVHAGASWCSPNDRFERKHGAMKARGRTLAKDHLESLPTVDGVQAMLRKHGLVSSRAMNFGEVFVKKALDPKPL